MLEIIIAALLTLGIITSPEQATQDVAAQYEAEIEAIIIEVDIEQM